MLEIDKIYNIDYLEGMKQIADNSVDCIICDLPYGVLNKQSEGGGWDSIIPLAPLWEQYLRIAKPNAAIILFCQGMFTAQLMMSQPKLWRYNLIWDKQRATGFLNAYKMPLRYHEDIAVFYRQQPTYHPQMEELNGRERSHPQGKGVHADTNRCYGDIDRFQAYEPKPENLDKKFPRSIIEIKREHDGKQFHPTQKPVSLLRYLVLTYSNRGGLSSTTAWAQAPPPLLASRSIATSSASSSTRNITTRLASASSESNSNFPFSETIRAFPFKTNNLWQKTGLETAPQYSRL